MAARTFTLPKDESLILPFNLPMGDIRLKYSTAQLLLKIDDRGTDHYFFFAPEGQQAEYCFDAATVSGRSLVHVEPGLKSTFAVGARQGRGVKVTTLTRQQALGTAKVDGRLIITDATVLADADGRLSLLSLGKPQVDYVVYPSAKGMTVQHAAVDPVQAEAVVKRVGTRRLSVHIDQPEAPQVREYFLRVDYTADVAQCFVGGVLVQDEFYHGEPWTIGLRRYREQLRREDMSFYFRPLRSDVPFLDQLPNRHSLDFSDGPILDLRTVEVVPQYQFEIAPLGRTSGE